MCYNNYSSNTNRNNNINIIDNTKQIMNNNSSNNSNNSKQIISDTIINNSNGNIDNSNSNSNSNNIINGNSIKDNFRTPLTPLHRGGRERLHMEGLGRLYMGSLEENLFSYNNNNKENVIASEAKQSREMSNCYKVNNCTRLLRRFTPHNDRRTAFSLIELSIVLIIIGLLVAGVTGGKSLIESAKTRALMNEIRNYNQAFTTFYVANGRLPGDANRDGKVDESDVDFYDFKDKDKYIDILPNGKYLLSMIAPWNELYDEKIIDFKPPIIECDGSLDCLLPKSKAFNNFVYDIFNGYYDYDGEAMENKMDDGKLFLKLKKYHTDESYTLSNFIKTNVIKQIDEKIDDGIIDTGRFRAVCFDKDIIIDWDNLSSYQDLKDGGCINIYNILDIN